MKEIKFIFWLVIAITYGLAPIWAVGFGIGSIIFVVIQILVPTTPIVMPVFFYIMFVFSMVASTILYGQTGGTDAKAPPPQE